jgi:hypothetical protein
MIADPVITLWRNYEDRSGQPWEPEDKSWERIFAKLESPLPFKGEAEHPGWSAGRFADNRRLKANARQVCAVVFDYDNKLTEKHADGTKTVRMVDDPVTFGAAAELWGEHFGQIHTSKSHTPEWHRLRVVIPLSRPVSGFEYEALWARLESFAGIVDPQTKDPSRFWYLPSRSEHFASKRLNGNPLDVDLWLAKPEPAKAPPPRPPAPRMHDPSKVERRAIAYLQRIDGATSGQGGHPQTWRAALALARGFDLSEEQTFSLLWSEFNHRCSPPWSEKELRHKAKQARNAKLTAGYLLGDEETETVTAKADRRRIESALPPEPPMREPGDDTDEAEAASPVPAPERAAKILNVRTMREILTASRIDAFSTEKVDSLTTAHYRLDDITGGIRAPDSWLIAADTSFGKTSWLIAIADENILKHKKRVLIVSTEDSDKRFGGRFMVRRSGVNAKRYRNRMLTADEKRRVVDVESRGEPEPTYVDVRQRYVEDLCPLLVQVIDDEGIDFIAFDYLQEFDTKRRYQDERIKFKDIAKQLRAVGRAARRPIPSAILSQLTLNEKTGIPTRANIRECKDVGNAADAIMIGFEPAEDVRDRDGIVVVQAETKCIYVDKCKDGERKAKVPMKWNAESACFDTVHDPDVERYQQFDDFPVDNSEERFP